jgi:hypothetical protein
MFTVADVIDKYGYLMTEEQLEALEAIYPIRSAGYNIGGLQNDGSYYDATRTHEWNVNMPSLAYRQYTSMMSGFSPSLLNLFCEQGLDALQSCTPWALLIKSLENERYRIMEDKFHEQTKPKF